MQYTSTSPIRLICAQPIVYLTLTSGTNSVNKGIKSPFTIRNTQSIIAYLYFTLKTYGLT